jgi:hypothetical protein
VESIGFVVVGCQEFFGVVVGVDARLPVVEVRRWDPFGFAFGVFAGGPAFFGEPVVRTAGQGEVVDVGAPGLSPALDVVDLAVVGGRVTARLRTPTILGIQHDSLRRTGQPFRVIQRQGLAVVEDGQVVCAWLAQRITSDIGSRVPPPVRALPVAASRSVKLVVTTIDTGRPLCRPSSPAANRPRSPASAAV